MQCGGVQGFRGLVKQLLFLAYRVIFVASIIKVGAAAVARPGTGSAPGTVLRPMEVFCVLELNYRPRIKVGFLFLLIALLDICKLQ